MLSANYHRTKSKILNILSVALLCTFSLPSPNAEAAAKITAPDPLSCDRKFNETVLRAVDKHVRNSLYSKELSAKVWPAAMEKQKDAILSAGNLLELSDSINVAIDELKSSHCRFLTVNDDTYYFLYSLFSHHKPDGEKKGSCVFPGFVTGGAGFDSDRVRYVLDDSPAQKAHIQKGDQILSVNGGKYVGLANFFELEGKPIQISLKRAQTLKTVSLKASKKPMYDAYVNAVTKSATKFMVDELKLGYVHLWCGGKAAQEAMADVLFEPLLKECDGLILDLRDGYGACSPDALDPFFRQPNAFPDFETTNREGKKSTSSVVFAKPMVALINGGSRSGKEELAYALKKAGRALLLGDRTAGYFLAGSLEPINDRCSLYLAVLDCSLSGVRLEGVGVEPDLRVSNDKTSAQDNQLERAKIELVKRIKEAKSNQ